MKYRMIAIALVSLMAMATLMATGCKQGRGERCQVDADCANGLTCSQSEPKTCGGDNTQQEDADFPDVPVDVTGSASADNR